MIDGLASYVEFTIVSHRSYSGAKSNQAAHGGFRRYNSVTVVSEFCSVYWLVYVLLDSDVCRHDNKNLLMPAYFSNSAV